MPPLKLNLSEFVENTFEVYLEGGSIFIGTNTFSSTSIAMADYEMESYVYELNYESARLAREV